MISIPDFAIFFLIYALINGVVFFIFAFDKYKAGKNTWRTPENAVTGFCPYRAFWTFAAMLLFRHKTRKLKFYLVPVIALLHVILIIWLLLYVMH